MSNLIGRLFAAFVLSAWPVYASAEAQPVTVTPVLTTSQTAAGQPLAMPQGEAQVTVARFTIAPGAQLPVHEHPFPRMAYVLSGSLIVTDVETDTESTYAAGEFMVEMVNTWHFGRNDGTEPVELLVIDLGQQGQSNTITREP